MKLQRRQDLKVLLFIFIGFPEQFCEYRVELGLICMIKYVIKLIIRKREYGEFKQWFPNATFKNIKARHFIQREQPYKLVKALVDHINIWDTYIYIKVYKQSVKFSIMEYGV